MMDHKDVIKFTRTIDDKFLEKVVEVDVTEFNTEQFFSMIIELMRFQGYHDVSIHKGLVNSAEELFDYMESVANSMEKIEPVEDKYAVAQEELDSLPF